MRQGSFLSIPHFIQSALPSLKAHSDQLRLTRAAAAEVCGAEK